jgi:hypothetical protein
MDWKNLSCGLENDRLNRLQSASSDGVFSHKFE